MFGCVRKRTRFGNLISNRLERVFCSDALSRVFIGSIAVYVLVFVFLFYFIKSYQVNVSWLIQENKILIYVQFFFCLEHLASYYVYVAGKL